MIPDELWRLNLPRNDDAETELFDLPLNGDSVPVDQDEAEIDRFLDWLEESFLSR